MPTAIQRRINPPKAPLAIPVGIYPSRRSMMLLIKGTPGIRNKTAVATDDSGHLPNPYRLFNPDIVVVMNAEHTMEIIKLKDLFVIS